MITFYQGYRIITAADRQGMNFDIFLGSRCEATGYLLDDFSCVDMSTAASERAKDLIDAKFETPILHEIRKIAKY